MEGADEIADRWLDEKKLPSNSFGAVCNRDSCTIATEAPCVKATVLAVEATCARR